MGLENYTEDIRGLNEAAEEELRVRWKFSRKHKVDAHQEAELLSSAALATLVEAEGRHKRRWEDYC